MRGILDIIYITLECACILVLSAFVLSLLPDLGISGLYLLQEQMCSFVPYYPMFLVIFTTIGFFIAWFDDLDSLLFFSISALVGLVLTAYSFVFHSYIKQQLVEAHTKQFSAILNKRSVGVEAKVFMLNVLYNNENYSKVSSLIESRHPTMVGLFEAGKDWVNNLDLINIYPYTVEHLPLGTRPITFYSKWPILSAEIGIVNGTYGEYYGYYMIFTVEPQLKAAAAKKKNCKPLRVIMFHPVPPKTLLGLYIRNELIDILIDKIRSDKLNTLVLADLNASPFSSAYKKFKRSAQLFDFWTFFKRPITWTPLSSFPYFGASIDYFFSKGEIIPMKVETLSPVGSDHLPLYGTFIVKCW